MPMSSSTTPQDPVISLREKKTSFVVAAKSPYS
jgi:hypothetical protein